MRIFTLLCICVFAITAWADPVNKNDKEESKLPEFEFTVVKQIGATCVKNQSHTGTCWSFATSSFLESELLRAGKGEHDLSEMFVVRHTYPLKARNYVLLHGSTTLGAGSLAQDVFRIAESHGVVPEAVYNGKLDGEDKHNHGELDAMLKGALDSVIKQKKLTKVWPQAIEAILDVYLGTPPQEFTYQGKSYTPESLAKELGIKASNYVELTSFTHHPFYSEFSVEVPDNWARNRSYNLPLDELMAAMDNALMNGYSVAWDGDVSEKSFDRKQGIAILPEKEWDDRSKKEQESLCKTPEAEKKVTQEMRQDEFENYSSTDDHLMHIIGIAKDQNGTKYYITKNSWGTKDYKREGFVYMSEAYVRCKTITILVNKKSLPETTRKNLRLGN